MKKKLFCCWLLLMTVLMMSSTAFAASTYVAKIGSRKYTLLSKAVKEVKSGGTITLLKNTSWSYPDPNEGLTGKKFTMNLANHTLTLKKLVHLGGGTNLTFKNGSIKGNHSDGMPCFEAGVYASQNNQRRTRLTFQNCKIRMLKRGRFVETNTKADIVMKNSDLSFAKAADSTAFEIGKTSTLKITGGSWSSGQNNQPIIDSNGTVKISNLRHNGNGLLQVLDGSASITSGTYNKIKYYARDLITVSGGGKLTISGGTFTSKSEGLICMSHGTMTMTGGTLRNTQVPEYNTYRAPSGSGSSYSPGHSGPVCILFESYGDSKSIVRLKGGKVISNRGCCIYRRADDNAKISISGATCRSVAGAPIIFKYSLNR